VKKLVLLALIPLSVLADDISWSTDCSTTNCGKTIDGSDTVTGDGDITTTADNTNAIDLNASSSNTLNLSGNLTTSGNGSEGIYFEGSSSNTLSLTGNISTSGIGANMIVITLNSDNNELSINGNLTSSGVDASIQLNRSSNNILNISGNVSTSGDQSHGFYPDKSNNNTIIINGNLVTTGIASYGLNLLSDNESNSITINGNISTSGLGSYGVYLNRTGNNSNDITINGNITTTGLNANGISINGNSGTSNSITVNGGITTESGDGIKLLSSDSNTYSIKGINVGLTSENGWYAIHAFNSDNNRFNLSRGLYVGSFYTNGNNNILDFTGLGKARSYVFATSGPTNFTLIDNNKPVIAGSAKSRGIADIDDEGNKLYQRFNPISRATSSQHKRMAMGHARNDFWIDGYYSDSDRTTSYKELNHKTRGLTVGFNVSGDRQLPLDLIVNFENSDTGYGQSDQSIDTNSVMAGLFYPKLMQAFNGSLALKFLTGVADNESDIKVANNTVASGEETITEDYSSYYVMVGGEWLQPLYKGNNIHHDIYLGLDVMHERINSHSSSSYFYMNDRDITQLNSSLHYGFSFNSDDKKLLIQAKAGIEQTDILEGEYQYYKIDGVATRFKGDERNTYITASLGADYKFSNNAKAYFNVQKFDSSDDIDGTSGNVGFIYNF